MAQKTFHVELRCIDVDDPVKFAAILKAAQRSARTLHAQATIVCSGQTPPQIFLYGEDFVYGKKELDLGAADDEE